MIRHPDPRSLWRDDLVDASERATILEHVGSCAECRGVVAAERPEMLFALLTQESIATLALDRLTARIDVAISHSVRAGADSSREPRWVPIAASLLLAALVGAYVWQRGVEPLAEVVNGRTSSGSSVALGAIEVDEPGEAEVVNVQIGDTTVVMIFDRGLDL